MSPVLAKFEGVSPEFQEVIGNVKSYMRPIYVSFTSVILVEEIYFETLLLYAVA